MSEYINLDDNVEVLDQLNYDDNYIFVKYKYCIYALKKEKVNTEIDFHDCVMFKDFNGYIGFIVEINLKIEIYHIPTYIEFQNKKYYIIYINNYPLNYESRLHTIIVDNDNLCHYSEDGVLFTMLDNKIDLALYPPKKKDQIYHIPKGITGIVYNAFLINNYIKEIYYKNYIIKKIKNDDWSVNKI